MDPIYGFGSEESVVSRGTQFSHKPTTHHFFRKKRAARQLTSWMSSVPMSSQENPVLVLMEVWMVNGRWYAAYHMFYVFFFRCFSSVKLICSKFEAMRQTGGHCWVEAYNLDPTNSQLPVSSIYIFLKIIFRTNDTRNLTWWARNMGSGCVQLECRSSSTSSV